MFGKSIDAKKVLVLSFMIMALLSGCGSNPAVREAVSGDRETSEETSAEEESESRPWAQEAFAFSDKGKFFLPQMCRDLKDFNAQTTMDGKFWHDFLFYSYTGASSEDTETEQVYREDLGFEETVVKVSRQEAEAYAKLIFGFELPDIRPSFEEMEEGQTSCYYQDGYYYIGVSDFPDYQYTLAEFTVYEEPVPHAVVKYNMNFEGESRVGTVSFTIYPEENENGFVIRSKTTVSDEKD